MEKKVFKFPSIEAFRNVIQNVRHRAMYMGEDEHGDPIYDKDKKLPVLDFRGTVKLHGCFSEDTMVMMSNGVEIPIKEVEVGDTILSYDIENNEFIPKKVLHTENANKDIRWLELEFDNGIKIKCTEDHKFYTKNRGWVEAVHLTSEDIFINII